MASTIYERWEIMDQEIKVEYKNNQNIGNNLNREGDLIVFSNYNKFTILSRIVDNISCYNLDKRDMLREVTVKIKL